VFSGTCGIIGMDELDLVFGVSIGDMSISVKAFRFSTEVSDDEFVGLNLLLKSSAGNLSGWWS